MTYQCFLIPATVSSLWLAGCGSSRQECNLGAAVWMGDGELTITRSEVRAAGDRMEIGVFFRWTGPADDLFKGFFGPRRKMKLFDSSGKDYKPQHPKWSPIFPIPEEMYGVLRTTVTYSESRGRDKLLEDDMVASAKRFEQLDQELKAGKNPVAWLHIFDVPLNSRGLAVIAENPNRKLGQPGAIFVPLGR